MSYPVASGELVSFNAVSKTDSSVTESWSATCDSAGVAAVFQRRRPGGRGAQYPARLVG